MLKHRLAHNAVLGAQRQRRLLAFAGWKLAVHSAKALVANSAAQRGQLQEREAMLGTLEARLAEARATHGRQLRSIQHAHTAELEAARAELIEAQEALQRLKTFSAHKLREMADELERTQQQLREQQQGHQQLGPQPTLKAAHATVNATRMTVKATHATHRSSALAAADAPAAAALDSAPDLASDGFGDGWDRVAPIGRVALGARGPNVSGDPKANPPATALRLDMQSLRLVSYEAQLDEGAAKVHRLERKLRHAEAARAELAEYKRVHEGTERLRAEQHAEAIRRVEALELLLANREAQSNAAIATRELESSAWRLKAEAKATAAEVLATASLVLERTRLREGVIRMRSQLAVWALRHWALSRARLCMRAWREYTARVQADRANAAVRAIALQREPDRYSPVGSTAAERLAAAATSAAAAALAASRAWHERNDLAAGGAAPAVAAPANAIASAAGAPSGLVGAQQPSPRGRPQSEVISGAQLGARQPSPRGRPQSEVISGAQLGARQPPPRGRPQSEVISGAQLGARQPSPRGRPQSEVISGAQLGARQPSPRGRPQSEVISGAQLGARQPPPRGRPPTATAAAAPEAASSSLTAEEAAAFIVNARASSPKPIGGDSPGTAPVGTAPIGTAPIGTAPRPVDAPPDATKYVYYAPRIGTPPRRRQKSRKWAGAPSGVGPLLVAAAPPPAGDQEVQRTRIHRRLATGP